MLGQTTERKLDATTTVARLQTCLSTKNGHRNDKKTTKQGRRMQNNMINSLLQKLLLAYVKAVYYNIY